MTPGGKRYVYVPSDSSVVDLWAIGDIHLGNRGCAENLLARAIDRIKADPCALWIGLGDYADHIATSDKRFDPATVRPDITVADLGNIGKVLTTRVCDIFEPIKGKCLGLLGGNHEWKYGVDKDQQRLHSWMCTELGVPDLGYSTLFDIVFRRNGALEHMVVSARPVPHHKEKTAGLTTTRVFAHHGAGAAQTSGGKLNRLVGFMNGFHADVYIIGHVHDQVEKRVVTLGANAACNEIVEKRKLGVVSGSYLKAYAAGVTSYAERKGYSPNPLGSTIIRFEPGRNLVRAIA